MAGQSLEDRLAAVEVQLAALQHQRPAAGANGHPTAVMTAAELEQRLAAVEASVQQLQASAVASREGAAEDPSAWVARLPKLSEESARFMEEMEPYQKYMRWTGRWPPDTWKPGDPIPDPDWWV